MLPAGKTARVEPSSTRCRLPSPNSDRKSTSSLARAGADMARLCSLTPIAVNDIPARRLQTQRLTGEPFKSPLDAIRWLTAVQSQDYAGAKWALGQRSRKTTDAALDRLFDQGAILRTHVLRPTWHFVLPEDIGWLLALTGPRIRAGASSSPMRCWRNGCPKRACSTAMRLSPSLPFATSGAMARPRSRTSSG